MTPHEREVMQMALDVITTPHPGLRTNLSDAMIYREKIKTTIETLRTALAQPEPVMWQNAALRLGEDLSTVGPDGYYNMTAKQWLDWALSVITKIQIDYMQLGACEEKSRKDYIGLILGVRVDDASVIIKTKNKDNAKYLCNELLNEKEIYYYPAPTKKEWVGLTDADWIIGKRSADYIAGAEWAEAKLKEKNT